MWNECTGSKHRDHEESGTWTSGFSSWNRAVTVCLFSGSNIAAFDLLASLWINAPAVAGAAAALGWVEVTVIIALGLATADDHAGVQKFSQTIEALSAAKSDLRRWWNIGAFDLSSSLRIGTPLVSGRTVALNDLVVAAGRALRDV